MPGTILWQSGPVISFASQLSGQGEALTNGSRVLCSGDFFNTGVSGGPAFFGVATLVASASGFGAALTFNASVDFYLVPVPDGSNANSASVSGTPSQSYRGSFLSPVSGNIPRMSLSLENIPLMPMRYQSWVVNSTGQTLTSGWSLFIDAYQNAYTG